LLKGIMHLISVLLIKVFFYISGHNRLYIVKSRLFEFEEKTLHMLFAQGTFNNFIEGNSYGIVIYCSLHVET